MQTESKDERISQEPAQSAAACGWGDRLVCMGSSLAKEYHRALTDPEFFTDVICAWIRDDPLPARLLPFTYPL